MRRRTPIVIGALAFAGAAVASGAHAQVEDPLDPPPESTTTSTTSRTQDTVTPPQYPSSTTTTTARTGGTTSSTVKPGGTTTTSTISRSPIPPPASGASQPLDPSLLGGVGPVDLNPTTTVVGGVFGTDSGLSPTTTFVTDNAITVASSTDGPSGGMLGLAAVAWLASLGGLLVYAEDQRGKQWRHLAR